MISAILGIWAIIKALLVFAAVGAAAGFVAAIGSRIIGGATGLLAAALLGALVVIGTNAAGYLEASRNCADKLELARLDAERAALERDLRVERNANEVQNAIIIEQQDTLNKNDIAMDRLDEIIRKHEDDPACVIHPDELEAINELR